MKQIRTIDDLISRYLAESLTYPLLRRKVSLAQYIAANRQYLTREAE